MRNSRTGSATRACSRTEAAVLPSGLASSAIASSVGANSMIFDRRRHIVLRPLSLQDAACRPMRTGYALGRGARYTFRRAVALARRLHR